MYYYGRKGLMPVITEDYDDEESAWSVAVHEKGGANKRDVNRQQVANKRRKTDAGFYHTGATISCPQCSQTVRAPVTTKALRAC